MSDLMTRNKSCTGSPKTSNHRAGICNECNNALGAHLAAQGLRQVGAGLASPIIQGTTDHFACPGQTALKWMTYQGPSAVLHLQKETHGHGLNHRLSEGKVRVATERSVWYQLTWRLKEEKQTASERETPNETEAPPKERDTNAKWIPADLHKAHAEGAHTPIGSTWLTPNGKGPNLTTAFQAPVQLSSCIQIPGECQEQPEGPTT